jgi:opacity protein-like surface antigen
MKKISLISALIGTSNIALAGFYAGGSVNVNQNKYAVNGLSTETSSFSKKMSRLNDLDSVKLDSIKGIYNPGAGGDLVLYGVAMSNLGNVIVDATFNDPDPTYADWFKEDDDRLTLFGNNMFQAASLDANITMTSVAAIAPDKATFDSIIAYIDTIDIPSGRFGKLITIYSQGVMLEDLSLTVANLESVTVSDLQARIDAWKLLNVNVTGVNVTGDEEVNIAKSASKTSLSVSILGGYSHKINHFILASEIGLDLGKTKIGDNSKNELEVKSNVNAFIVGRAGYEFYKMNTAYVNLGASIRDVKISLDGESEKKNMFNLVVGAGYEYSVNKKLGIFTEFNHIASLSSFKLSEDGNVKVKVKSEQFKIGARYYFN